uniref:Thyrotropin-releasing hormone receptor n=1 Tax=Ascaris lumbricoides TaxID=6252 RepID=A0A0M3HTI9_ASCLU
MNLTGTDVIRRLCPEMETTYIREINLNELLTRRDCKLQLELGQVEEFWPIDVRIIMTLIFASLSAVGIIGNLLVITVVFKVKGMLRATTSMEEIVLNNCLQITPTNCYLVSLAASDCLFFVATAPTELSYLHLEETEYIFGYFGCAFFTFLPYLAINTSSLSTVAFTIERYIGICHPIRARYMCTVKRAKTIISAIWLFCIIYNSPWLYLASLRVVNGEYSCSFKLERDHFIYKVMFLGDLLGFYVIPLLLYVVIYSKIAYTLTRSEMKEQAKMSASAETYAQFLQSSNLSQNTNAMRNFTLNCSKSSFKGKSQVVKMLALVVAIFAICWLPYRAMVMYNSFAQQKWDPDWYIFFSKTMIFFNCAINPILYNVMSARFRNAFRRLLNGKKKIIYQIERHLFTLCSMMRHLVAIKNSTNVWEGSQHQVRSKSKQLPDVAPKSVGWFKNASRTHRHWVRSNAASNQ